MEIVVGHGSSLAKLGPRTHDAYQSFSAQLSENASALVLNGLPSRCAGCGTPVACRPTPAGSSGRNPRTPLSAGGAFRLRSRTKVAELQAAFGDPTDGAAVVEAARSLIERAVLHPGRDGTGLEIELVGEIAAMLELELGRPVGQRGALDRDLFVRSVKVVAGTGFEPVTFRL